MKKVAIMLADGFEEIETIVPLDLLRRAGADVDLVSVSNEKIVTGDNGLKVEANAMLRGYDFEPLDALVIPGGSGYQIIEKVPLVEDEITSFANNPDKTLGAICAGSSILGNLGLYKDKKYTCVPDLNKDSFDGHFEKVHAVVDGNLVTGISVGGAFEFGFDLVEKLFGKKAADDLKKATCYKL